MRIIAKATLREFAERHPRAAGPLWAWCALAERATWKSPADIKATLANASIVGSDRAVFNIKGNDYRLIVAFDFEKEIAFVKFVGTHEEYDEVDAATVKFKR
jgi:mRNA interferase HigB